MRRRNDKKAALSALITLLLVLETPSRILIAAERGSQQPAASQAAVRKPATSQAPLDGGWPRTYATPSGGRYTIYQPQVATWANQKELVGYAAVSYRAKTAAATEKPSLGSIKLEADTSASLEQRLVHFTRIRITESNFSTLSREETRDLVAEITKTLPGPDLVIALDRVLANIDKSQIVPRSVEGIKADPPTIFFSKTRAVLVNFDGEPIWSPIKENDLKYAVNTNWDVFEHGPTKTYYLRDNATWLKTSDLKGPWAPAGKLPPSFTALPAEENWKDVKSNLPGKPLTAELMPQVFLSSQPAELILLRGEPSYVLVAGTNLLWVNNTESDVFRLGKTGPVYFLVTGRWFSAPDFSGPWTFATPNLPDDFKKISLEHERSRVLASVPGTPQAAEAVLLAQVPQTARVNKKELKPPEVVYQGAADFQSIEGTSLQRAVNTDKDIIQVGTEYYMCYQGVWFVAKAATGPWEVASSVPEEVYKIPASSPVHNVTYVVIEDSTSDTVDLAYMAGYTGMMLAWGCAVWGSGWYYPPYVGWGGYYPAYYPHFSTYGYSAWYNPWTGSYGRGVGAYGPYGGVGAGARYNPSTGTYARGAAAYGPYGARGVAQAYNPRTGAYGTTRQGSNVYGSWGSTAVQRGDDWAQTSRVTNRATGNTTRVTRTDEGSAISRRGPGGSGFVAAGDGGNVYAGRDGNVYKRDGGSWQKYENGGWGDVATPTPQGDRAAQARDKAAQAGTTDRATQARDRAGTTGDRGRSVDSSTYGQLERDRSARSEGAQRTRDYGGYRGGSGSAGSYRGGSRGGSRGGGGGRR
jgi:hypothetical protein